MDEWELFDLEKDPNEMNNIYNTSKKCELVTNLKNRLAALKKENKMDLSDDELKKWQTSELKDVTGLNPQIKSIAILIIK